MPEVISAREAAIDVLRDLREKLPAGRDTKPLDDLIDEMEQRVAHEKRGGAS